MSTLQQTMFEGRSAIRSWIDNARKNGISYLGYDAVRSAMKKCYMQEEDLAFLMRDVYGIDVAVVETHYILSSSGIRKIY